ncbi:MAG: nuclear transport factor 2 family protein [Solirubrobacteraceae bacterium]|nr:nuclear transport factor 2 family protein [Solirubrobacteraceae bacterium]
MSTAVAFDHARMVEVQQAIVRAIEERDADAFAELYAPDGALLPPDGSVHAGRDAVRAAFAGMLAEGFAKQTVVDPRLVVDDGLAVEEGRAVAEFHKDGEVVVGRCNYLIVHRRQRDGSWLMERDMWTAIPDDAPEPRVP